ncbi:Endoplasmic reticulum aminopeptidase 1 [Thelohanellus kitauei]|uniref:Endoplasmic reticulum aminopeptidase 1 n=1 Tax=Thelohanellus kitauei TaxID=669202 RepID=A0A0C2MDS0_THEKT|nr:Endoplasmic reticulum aminopeptidase 1 [Thelohanellus kitauei]
MLTHLDLEYFQGLVEIDMMSLSYNRRIILHQKDIEITRSELFITGTHSPMKLDILDTELFDKIEEIIPSIRIIDTSYEPQSEIVTFMTEHDLEPNQKLTLRLKYKAPYSKKLDGLYKTQRINSNKQRITIASTQFEPTSARKMFPCFDEPSMKATFQLTVIHDSNVYAISNMPQLEGYPKILTSNLTVSKFQVSVRMSTYLVSLSLIDFINAKTVTDSGVVIKVYAPESDANHLDFATSVAAKMLTFCEEFFGEKYPIQKLGDKKTNLDIVAMTEFMSGAMENFGHLIFRSTNLIYDPTRTTLDTKRQIMMVICHELAHQVNDSPLNIIGSVMI